MTIRKKQPRQTSLPAFFRSLNFGIHCGHGVWVLLGSLLILSLLAGANFESPKRIYVAGEIADGDIIADRDLKVEDPDATRARKKRVEAGQPTVYDYTIEPFNQFRNRIMDILRAINADGPDSTNPVVQRLIAELPKGSGQEVVSQLAHTEVQDYLLKRLLPMIGAQMQEGLVSDARSARPGRAGFVINDLDRNKEDNLRSDAQIQDVKSFLAEISAQLRHAQVLNQNERRALDQLLELLMPASLTLNQESTQQKIKAQLAAVEPVYFQFQKGELLLRKGERVSREQQIILQTLYKSADAPMQWGIFAGAFILSLVFSTGFFMAPSGKPGHPLNFKDMILISVVLLIFGCGAKGVYLLGLGMDSPSLVHSFAIAYPVTGAVGLVAMVFAARRYFTLGLILAFFAMLMFKASYPLFVYYFMGGMLATWLITRAQSRQDVVWSIIPLSLGLLIIWGGAAFIDRVPAYEISMQVIAVLINSLLSLIILFAISPVLEMIFGYSTRFRLMELMSLEHPLMQEIMVTIPGTYHHSLVVATMVEAGAKAIGANSLLCKVAALYHDAGKLTYPEYFIENQFGGPNKHDKLAPSMSSLVLLSHVKKGAELAQKYKLGQEITDIIQQHHGTRIMRYFYQKALNLGEKPLEADYCYPGPRPQSKEAAILMLADSVEASSRTLSDPTPARLRTHIDTIIKGIFAEGQLDESELTFKDLHYLSENFQRILTGLFHQRIVYPESKIKNRTQSGNSTAKQASDIDKPAQEKVA